MAPPVEYFKVLSEVVPQKDDKEKEQEWVSSKSDILEEIKKIAVRASRIPEKEEIAAKIKARDVLYDLLNRKK